MAVGPEVRQTAAASPPAAQAPPSPEQLRQLMEDTVAGQFETITAAAKGCDVLVAGMALQFALRSVAEQMGIPYVYAAWCPITLPSPHHAPPPFLSRAQTPAFQSTGEFRPVLFLQGIFVSLGDLLPPLIFALVAVASKRSRAVR